MVNLVGNHDGGLLAGLSGSAVSLTAFRLTIGQWGRQFDRWRQAAVYFPKVPHQSRDAVIESKLLQWLEA